MRVDTRRLPGGTTSACAENTYTKALQSPDPWNYLRVRGEYGNNDKIGNDDEELPPRARRIRMCGVVRTGATGTTSACAENTTMEYRADIMERNYLRVRGEYPK